MEKIIESIIVILLLTDILILGLRRIQTLIKVSAFQGILLGVFVLLSHTESFNLRIVSIGLVTIVIKGYFFPKLMFGAINKINIPSELDPYIGYAISVFFGLAGVGFSLWLASKLPLGSSINQLPAAVSLLTIFVGLFILMSRKMAITQVVGYLVLENGIYLLGMKLVGDVEALVEIGILLDVFVAVFVMGIAVYQINKQFSHIDVSELHSLKG